MRKENWGPKMAALPNDRWRRFVVEWLDGAKGGHGGNAKGYSAALRRAGWKGKSDAALAVSARRIARDPRVLEAIQEEARKRLRGAVPMALAALDEIVEDKAHKDRLAAVKSVLDRAGLHEVREEVHRHEVFIADDPMMLERVRQLAGRLGVPVERLLGKTAAGGLSAPLALPSPVEAEFEEVEAE